MMESLTAKTVLVTGAAKRIGRGSLCAWRAKALAC